jgi:hypothetical protein
MATYPTLCLIHVAPGTLGFIVSNVVKEILP